MDQRARSWPWRRWAALFGLMIGSALFPVSYMLGLKSRAAIELMEPWNQLSVSMGAAEIESALEMVTLRNRAELIALRMEFMGYLMASLTLGASAFTWANRERDPQPLSRPHCSS